LQHRARVITAVLPCLIENIDEEDDYQPESEQHIPACLIEKYSLDCMNSAHKGYSDQDHYRENRDQDRENIYHEKSLLKEIQTKSRKWLKRKKSSKGVKITKTKGTDRDYF
jgi:hypothetical protein